jgi:hypothetical protein
MLPGSIIPADNNSPLACQINVHDELLLRTRGRNGEHPVNAAGAVARLDTLVTLFARQQWFTANS